jgi:hypothetical protein
MNLPSYENNQCGALVFEKGGEIHRWPIRWLHVHMPDGRVSGPIEWNGRIVVGDGALGEEALYIINPDLPKTVVKRDRGPSLLDRIGFFLFLFFAVIGMAEGMHFALAWLRLLVIPDYSYAHGVNP